MALNPWHWIQRFFHEPVETGTAYRILRIFYGFDCLFYLLSLRPLLPLFYGRNSICPLDQPAFLLWNEHAQFSFFELMQSPAAVVAIWALALLNTFLVIAGLRIRVVMILQFLFLSSFFLSPCHADNYGDQIFVSTAFLLMFMPKQNGPVSPWLRQTLRLFLCTLYLSSALPRWQGEAWWNGDALWTSLIDPTNSHVWQWLAAYPTAIPGWLFKMGTWLAMGFELAFPVFIWFRRFRTPLVLCGIIFHLSMGWLLDLGLFPMHMILLLIACLNEATLNRAWHAIRKFFRWDKSKAG